MSSLILLHIYIRFYIWTWSILHRDSVIVFLFKTTNLLLLYFSLGVSKILPILLTIHQTEVSVGLALMHFHLLDDTHQSSCSVSWWCAGAMTILPAAIKAVLTGSRGMQDLRRKKWVLLLDLSSFRRLPLRTEMLVLVNNFHLYLTQDSPCCCAYQFRNLVLKYAFAGLFTTLLYFG